MTRSDFDGLVCAVLLQHLDMIDDITFVHPKDMQDGKVAITGRDITTNLPYVDGVYLAFDHHASEILRNEVHDNHLIDAAAPSAARVVWEHFGGHEVFPAEWDEMLAAVDKADAARFSREDILDPTGWDLLNFVMDPRTGLGRFREFRISNYQLMMELIEACKQHPIEEILEMPDVVERVELYTSHAARALDQIERCASIHENLVLLDLTGEATIWATNRFTIYAMFPEADISIHKMWGFQQQNIVFATGKSIIDRSCTTHVGELMLRYGGGGHTAAGTCQVPIDQADEIQLKLIDVIVADHRDKLADA